MLRRCIVALPELLCPATVNLADKHAQHRHDPAAKNALELPNQNANVNDRERIRITAKRFVMNKL